jgi:hypothetical protein
MKSWLMDAESILTFSHSEGENSVYTLRVSFKDLFGRERTHFAPVSIHNARKFEDRISFTALSNIEIRPAVIEGISDLNIEVSTLFGRLTLPNIHNHEFGVGQSVIIVEHTDISGDHEMMNIAIPYPLTMEPDMLRLQSVNADVIAEDGQLICRLSADPLYQGSSFK